MSTLCCSLKAFFMWWRKQFNYVEGLFQLSATRPSNQFYVSPPTSTQPPNSQQTIKLNYKGSKSFQGSRSDSTCSHHCNEWLYCSVPVWVWHDHDCPRVISRCRDHTQSTVFYRYSSAQSVCHNHRYIVHCSTTISIVLFTRVSLQNGKAGRHVSYSPAQPEEFKIPINGTNRSTLNISIYL